MKISLNLFGRNFDLALGKSALSPEMSAWMRAEDVDQGGKGAEMTSPYSQSAWVYIAVTRLAEKVAQIPFRISRIGGGQSRRVRALRHSAHGPHRAAVRRALNEDIVDSGEVVDLFNAPHPTMNRSLFWEMLVTWLSLRGEFFVLPLDDADSPVDLTARSPRVKRLIPLPTELFWHIVTGYELTAWRYTGSPLLTPIPSEILLPGEVIHSRSPNPYLYWRGMSPLLLAMVPAGADYAAAKYAQGYWLNNADTGVIVTTDQMISDPAQREAILAALRERKRKAGTADRPLFLWGGAKVEKPQLNGMEQQFIANREMNRQEIGAIFKVPESVMGFSSNKSSALSGGGQAINAEQVQFIEGPIATICAQIEDALAPVVRSFGEDLVGWFDCDCLPVMQEARRNRLDSASKAFGLGFPINAVNELYDLGYPALPWGNKSFLPFSLQEVGADGLPGEDDPANPPAPDDDGDDDETKSNPLLRGLQLLKTAQTDAVETRADSRANRARLWQQHIRTRARNVKAFHAKVRKVLFQFRAAALAKLDEIHLEKTTIAQRGLVDLIFDAHKFGLSLHTELANPTRVLLQAAGKELISEVGKDDPWLMPPKAAQSYLDRRTQSIMGVGGTVRDRINTQLNVGLDNGESTAELAGRVRDSFNKFADGDGLSEGEAMRVARTEVNMAYGFSRQTAMKDVGIEYKTWLSSHGPNVREGHAMAEDTYSDAPIPIDEPFIVPNKDGLNERMMFPGDDSLGASAGNIINCQCIQLAALPVEETETTETFKIFGLGNETFPKGNA